MVMAMKHPTKTAPRKMFVLGVRVDPDLKADIEAAAARKEWSVSQWLARAARDAIGKKGKQP